jgi:hypothetical protein
VSLNAKIISRKAETAKENSGGKVFFPKAVSDVVSYLSTV